MKTGDLVIVKNIRMEPERKLDNVFFWFHDSILDQKESSNKKYRLDKEVKDFNENIAEKYMIYIDTIEDRYRDNDILKFFDDNGFKYIRYGRFYQLAHYEIVSNSKPY